jgi:hypothetical protein
MVLCHISTRIFSESKGKPNKNRDNIHPPQFGAHVYAASLTVAAKSSTDILPAQTQNYVSSRATADTDQSSVLTATH